MIGASAQTTSGPFFWLAAVIWMSVNVVVGVRFLHVQNHYLKLLRDRQGITMPTITGQQTGKYPQTTSFFPDNLRYFFHSQPDDVYEKNRKLLIRRFIQIFISLGVSSLVFFGVGILAFG